MLEGFNCIALETLFFAWKGTMRAQSTHMVDRGGVLSGNTSSCRLHEDGLQMASFWCGCALAQSKGGASWRYMLEAPLLPEDFRLAEDNKML